MTMISETRFFGFELFNNLISFPKLTYSMPGLNKFLVQARHADRHDMRGIPLLSRSFYDSLERIHAGRALHWCPACHGHAGSAVADYLC
jgi:hypothetical protein